MIHSDWKPSAFLTIKDGVILAGLKKIPVKIPEGYFVVTSGISIRGDKYLFAGDLYDYILWYSVSGKSLDVFWEDFGILIRPVKEITSSYLV